MTDEAIAGMSVFIIGMGVLAGTAILTHVLRRRFGRTPWLIPTIGLAGPILVVLTALVFITTDDPDGPPPGMVLIGYIGLAAILAPITFFVSWLTVRFVGRS
jgi:hypothetical protein